MSLISIANASRLKTWLSCRHLNRKAILEESRRNTIMRGEKRRDKDGKPISNSK